MIDFNSKELNAYVESFSQSEPDCLKKLERKTHLKLLYSRMISGSLQGRVLKMLVSMIRPQRVLELGTFSGYSALCIAEALHDDAELDTVEINDELRTFLTEVFQSVSYGNKINLYFGDAMDRIKALNHSYDLVFIDANKRIYIEYYNAVIDKVPSGGFIIADNVLWDGHVLDQERIKKDSQTSGIYNFNKMVLEDDRVENVIFPIRDGLNVIRKL